MPGVDVHGIHQYTPNERRTMTIKIFDTWTRTVREFEPLKPGVAGIYCCGPTVYNYAHIGNLRTYLFEDFLRRMFEFNGVVCNHVVNITDVGHLVSDADSGNDKMEEGSKRTGKSAWDIAKEYTEAFKSDLTLLNIKHPTTWCRATDHIPEQIAFVQEIESKGFTYRTSDGIYFDTSRLEGYGYLARLNVEGLQSGARVDLGEKRNSTDFALWKFSPKEEKRQMEWPSPWGVGFPGWHIECSAMASKYLGDFFDIHCGGEDHIPVHHTNEIAQTQVARSTRLANYWMHAYFLQLQESKMSKSSGEFLRLKVLIDKGYEPAAYRFLCLGAHYRSHLNFSWESLDAAGVALGRMRSAFYALPQGGTPDARALQQFRDFINDDLNVPRALALAWEVLRSDLPGEAKRATLVEFDRVFGLQLAEWQPKSEEIPTEIAALLEARQKARVEKRWADADAARDAIAKAGYELKDTPKGPVVTKTPGR
jgi:cysteinyl-tRNA synthetase